MSQETMAVAVEEKLARIKVNGRATFGCSEDLKKFCNLMLGNNVDNIIIDMQNCAGMPKFPNYGSFGPLTSHRSKI